MHKMSSQASVASSKGLLDQPSETPIKTRRRKRLRRLADASNEDKLQPQRSFSQQLKRYAIGTLVMAAAIAVLLGHFYRQNESNSHALRDFLSSYHKHYKQIVTGQQNYCDQLMDMHAIFAGMREQKILHQEQAMLQLELALRNDSLFQPLALVGPHGVGKSLVARALMENFPWPENVHSYAWNTFVRDDTDKFGALQMIADRISDCGCNLLVIENMQPKDSYAVKCLNEMLLATTKQQSKSAKKLIVLYLFSLNTFQQLAQYKQQHAELQQLPDTHTINLRAFGSLELRDCVHREAIMANLTLSAEDFEEIIDSIDAARSGCKTVHAKLLVYGKS